MPSDWPYPVTLLGFSITFSGLFLLEYRFQDLALFKGQIRAQWWGAIHSLWQICWNNSPAISICLGWIVGWISPLCGYTQIPDGEWAHGRCWLLKSWCFSKIRTLSLKFMSILEGFVRERIRVREVSIGIENMQHENTPHSFPLTFLLPENDEWACWKTSTWIVIKTQPLSS